MEKKNIKLEAEKSREINAKTIYIHSLVQDS